MGAKLFLPSADHQKPLGSALGQRLKGNRVRQSFSHTTQTEPTNCKTVKMSEQKNIDRTMIVVPISSVWLVKRGSSVEGQHNGEYMRTWSTGYGLEMKTLMSLLTKASLNV